jgi:hypothetical protein
VATSDFSKLVYLLTSNAAINSNWLFIFLAYICGQMHIEQSNKAKLLPENSTAIKFIVILAATLITAYMGLQNNFPFLYPDSFGYLDTSLTLVVPNDRPIFYPLFLRIVHLADNLNYIIYVQSALLAATIYLAFSPNGKGKYWVIHYLGTILLISLFTGYSFYASYIMPDFFGIIFFISFLILFICGQKTKHLVIASLLLLLSIVMHNAHFYLYVLLLFPLIIVLVKRKKQLNNAFGKRILLGSVALILAQIISHLPINTPKKGTASEVKAKVFFTARLNEAGILSEYLKENCSTMSHPLCAFKDSLKGDYLWDANSPKQKLGGYAAPRAIYDDLISGILSKPKYLKLIGSLALQSTLQQFFSYDIEPQRRQGNRFIAETFKRHKLDADISMQNRDRLNFESLNTRQNMLVLFCLLACIFTLLYLPHLPLNVKISIQLLLLFLLFNAFVFGTFSTVLVRYQGRIICLLPMYIALFAPQIYQQVKEIIATKSF